MRQSGILAAAGIFALENNMGRLAEDHKRVKEMAKGNRDDSNWACIRPVFISVVNTNGGSVFYCDLGPLDTNMLFVNINSKKIDAAALVERMAKVSHVKSKCLLLAY